MAASVYGLAGGATPTYIEITTGDKPTTGINTGSRYIDVSGNAWGYNGTDWVQLAGGGGGAPSGPAGGDLGGTYPNPTVLSIAHVTDTYTANTVYAGPTSGGAVAPTFRSLVAADIGTGTPSSATLLRGDMTWSQELTDNLYVDKKLGVGTITPGNGITGFSDSGVETVSNSGGSYILATRQTGLAHGMTALFPTDVGAVWLSPGNGGIGLYGLSENTGSGYSLVAINTGASTTSGNITLEVAKASGTGATDLAATDLALNVVQLSATSLMHVYGNGDVTTGGAVVIGSVSAARVGKVLVPSAPDATADYGVVNIGGGGFAGGGAPNFAGNANGTHVAVNTTAGYAGRMLDLQVAGVRMAAIGKGTVASATSAVLQSVEFPAFTTTITGNTAITTVGGFNYVYFGVPTYTAASAVAITIGATVAIAGAPAVAGSATLTTPLALWVLSGAIRSDGQILGTANGALSAPGITANGTWIATGGTATTTKPYVLIEPAGTTSTGWNTAGTGLGVNASNANSIIIDAQFSGLSKVALYSSGIALANNGLISWSSTTSALGAADVTLARLAAASLRLGAAPNATPVNQTFTIGEASRPTTDTNVAGANGTIQSGLGTGNATGSSIIFATPTAVASGSSVQTYATRLTINSTAATFVLPVLVPDGSVSAVAIGRSAAPTTGFIFLAGSTQIVINGTKGSWFGAAAGLSIQLPSTGGLGFSSTTDPAGTTDISILRLAAASLQFGAGNSATPASYTLTIGESARAGTDSDKSGGSATLYTGRGTGIGANAAMTLNAYYQVATGSGAKTAFEGLRIQGVAAAPGISFFGATSVVQQTVGAVTNSVTSGGVDGTIADYTDLTVYANDSAAIRNDIYQLARSVAQISTALRNYGLGV